MTANREAPRPDLAALGQVVKRRREQRGLTLEQLALDAGVSRRTLSYVEAGAHAVTVENLRDIAHALGVRLSTLVEEAEVGPGEEASL